MLFSSNNSKKSVNCKPMSLIHRDAEFKMNKENVEIIAGALNDFMGGTIAEMNLLHGYHCPRGKATSIHFQVVERTKALLEVLEELGNYYDCSSKVDLTREIERACAEKECGEMSTTSCQDMSFTFIDKAGCDPNETKYLSDMEITCVETSLSATPFVSIKSILKSGGQTLKTTKSTRKVRFEDEALNETWASIVENKENWEVEEICSKLVESYDGCSSETQNTIPSMLANLPSSNKKQSKRLRKLRGKTMETWKILRRNDKPRKSWSSSPRTRDVNALRDIKTLVELKNDSQNDVATSDNAHSPNKKCKYQCADNCVRESVNGQPQKSWFLNRRSRDITALEDITISVELKNDKQNNVGSTSKPVHSPCNKLNCASVNKQKSHTRSSHNEALASSTPINGDLRLSLIPNDIDFEQFHLSWTPKLDVFDSSISF